MSVLLSGCVDAPPTVVPGPGSNSLILNLFGEDPEVIKARVAAAAEATAPDGWLVIDYAPRELLKPPIEKGRGLSMPIEMAIAQLPDSAKRRILLTRFAEPYPWIRDSAFGWETEANGRARIDAGEQGNQGTVHSAASITTLLNACADSPLDLPRIHERLRLQEGMLVSNGAGLCVANKRVSERVREGDDPSILEELGCRKVIAALDWEEWRKQGHPNGHIDMSVAFVASRVAVIPKLDATCKTRFETGWDMLRAQLNEAGIETIEIPVASGCIGPKPVVRSYSNMVVLRDSLLVARFIGERFESSNDQAVRILERAMASGKIPRRRIIPFPVGDEIEGGSVHCMSLNVPGPLSGCTQSHLDSVLLAQADEAVAAAAHGPRRRAQELRSTLDFVARHVKGRTLQPYGQAAILLSESSRSKIEAAARALESALRR